MMQPVPSRGEIALLSKAAPTHNVTPSERAAIVCLSCRCASVGGAAAALRAKLLSDEARIWATDAACAARLTNVYIARPYHDRLGIGNVPFIFCDDNIQTVYRCPWYAEWRPLLIPIFAAIGVDERRVARCVLARLPPGVTIPPHHDQGHWVSMTHRMHCPLITSPGVVFSAGHTIHELARHHLPTGVLCELNNAAKHSVVNGGDAHRVHLMFDYVDGPSVVDAFGADVVDLAPGSELRRVGRALIAVPPAEGGASSAAATAPAPPAPTTLSLPFARCALSATSGGGFFVVIGAMKCGTSSLFDYISQHPRALPAIRKELHFFDWKWASFSSRAALLRPEQLRATAAAFAAPLARAGAGAGADDGGGAGSDAGADAGDGAHLTLVRRRLCCMFNTARLFGEASLCAGEATPSYCLGGSAVARRVRRVAPHARIIFVVRDPVARAWSHWNMISGGDPHRPIANTIGRSVAARQASFADAVEHDIAELARAGVRGGGDGAAADVAADAAAAKCDDAAFDARYLARRPEKHGSHSYVGRGLYAAQLRVWLQHFPREQVLLIPLSKLKTRSTTTPTMRGVFR